MNALKQSGNCATEPASVAQPFTPVYPPEISGFPKYGHIDLSKVANARDLGGMPTKDGRRIRQGVLIRSGDPHSATKQDCQTLIEEHHLKAIFDFRTAIEIEHSPDPILQLPGVNYIHVSALPEDEVLVGVLADAPKDMQIMHQFVTNASSYMEHMYTTCVTGPDGIQAYTSFLKELVEISDGAVLWHCTQGKDRTGIAALLIEHILGVSAEHIRQDYVATNLFMKGWLEKFEARLRQKHKLEGIDLGIEAYMYAALENLNAALGAIQKTYGSLDAYICDVLGCAQNEQDELRARYLV